jgi:predicted nucleic acid-binding protein
MILVDSSAWIESLRRDGSQGVKRVVASLLDDGEVCTCGPIQLEILGAARKEERKLLDSFFLAIPSLSSSQRIWKRATALSRTMRDGGCTIPWNDLVIATIALEYEKELFSVDKHFNQIAQFTELRFYRDPQKE